MYKKFIAILLLCAAVLIGCMACKKDLPAMFTSEPTSGETTLGHSSGVVDMPTGFTPPADDATEAPTAATEATQATGATESTDATEATEPSTAPTEPSVEPTLPNKPADQVTFEEFMAMDPYAQTDFIKTFEAADFHAWFQAALAEYKKTHPDFEYNGGAIELPT